MELNILGSGGCTVIPKPLCRCRVCNQARLNGAPYNRTGPSAFIHDINMLIDTPAEVMTQLNRENIEKVDYLLFTHTDPDHVEGFRVVEQIALDFRSWHAYPQKQILFLVPNYLYDDIHKIRSPYGSYIDFYETQGFIKTLKFESSLEIGNISLSAIPVSRDTRYSSVFVFMSGTRKIIYAPCDIKPFPVDRKEVLNADLFVLQPGIFENGLKHDFEYPRDHISRKTLYTFEESMALAREIKAKKIIFTHLEEYWNRSFDDYLEIQKKYEDVFFAFDGMKVKV